MSDDDDFPPLEDGNPLRTATVLLACVALGIMFVAWLVR